VVTQKCGIDLIDPYRKKRTKPPVHNGQKLWRSQR
jgi:hypothetical protein